MYLLTAVLVDDAEMEPILHALEEAGVPTLLAARQKLRGPWNGPCLSVSALVRGRERLDFLTAAVMETVDRGTGGFFFITPVTLAGGWPPTDGGE